MGYIHSPPPMTVEEAYVVEEILLVFNLNFNV